MLILILVVAFLILWFIIGKLYINLLKNTPYYKGKSPFFNGLTFNRLNKRHTVPKINFFTLVKYFIFKKNPIFKYEKWQNPKLPIPVVTPASTNNEGIKCYFINHSTVLLQVDGLNIITDPVYAKTAGLFQIGPKRVHAPGIAFDNLPTIDLILLSHNHYDHMDTKTLVKLQKRDNSLVVTPLGNDYILKRKYKKSKIVTLDWEEHFQYNTNTIIYLEKAYHWSRRSLYDQNKALWGGFVVATKNYKIYYSGDTALVDGKIFQEIGKKHQSFDLALIPIGAYLPYEFMKYVHTSPEDAATIHKLVNAKKSIGIHWGTFQLSGETYYQPKQDLEIAKGKLGIPTTDFITLAPSEYLKIN